MTFLASQFVCPQVVVHLSCLPKFPQDSFRGPEGLQEDSRGQPPLYRDKGRVSESEPGGGV